MPRRIILGTDWWTDCDDAAAVRIVCRLVKQGVWSLAGVVLNACMPDSAASLDGFLAYEGVRCPVGIDRGAVDFGGHPPYQQNMAASIGTGLRCEDCEDGVRLYRRLLSAAPDGETELLEIGYTQVLAGLLTSAPDDLSPLDGVTLVRRKVRHIWMMAGNWQADGHGRENNFARNARTSFGAQTLLSVCPVDITFLGFEIGITSRVHPKPDEADPLFRAFRDHGSAGGRYGWDPLLVLLAAAGDPALAGYRTVSGLASVDAATGENHFDAHPEHPVRTDRYVVKTMPDAWYEAQMDALV